MGEKKLTSYQKLKIKKEEEIRTLTQQIITLVKNEDPEAVEKISMEWKFRLLQAEAYLQGDTYFDKIKSIGLGWHGIFPFVHYEETK